MDSEDKLYLGFWSLIAAVIITLIVTVGINIHYKNSLVAEASTCEKAVILKSSDSTTAPLQIAACRGVVTPMQLMKIVEQ